MKYTPGVRTQQGKKQQNYGRCLVAAATVMLTTLGESAIRGKFLR